MGEPFTLEPFHILRRAFRELYIKRIPLYIAGFPLIYLLKEHGLHSSTILFAETYKMRDEAHEYHDGSYPIHILTQEQLLENADCNLFKCALRLGGRKLIAPPEFYEDWNSMTYTCEDSAHLHHDILYYLEEWGYVHRCP